MATRCWNYARFYSQFLVLVFFVCCLTSASARTFIVGPQNRSLCEPSAVVPPNRVNSAARLAALRAEMASRNLSAYLVVMTDEHGSFSGSGYNARVAYMSGFTGSNGWAVVTETEAAVWTDGRYFLQADQQMDCNWTLHKMSVPGYPKSTSEWLVDILPPGSSLGAFPNIISQSIWESESSVVYNGISFEAVSKDLVDLVWTAERPPKPNNPLIVHSIDFAGETWSSKLSRTRQKMSEERVDILVVTVLEQVAYVQEHLNTLAGGLCWDNSSINCVNVYEYDDVYEHIRQVPKSQIIWVDPSANQAVYDSAKAAIRFNSKPSPIELMKSIKNSVERQHFAECILRDSAAVVEFAAFMEEEIKAGRKWTEIEAADKMNSIRANYTNNRGISFNTISAFGPNAAVIHYRPDEDTVAAIDASSVYLLDSGGQYLDGTTDVTRTFHYGTPTDIVKEAYTRVLMGQIDLANTVWNDDAYGAELDIRARYPLYQHGWDYNHGTGHGIGYFLSVHEGPGRINKGMSGANEYLQEGMFFSDEPGYYEDGSFGIRLENLVTVVAANTPNRFGNKNYLKFKTLTLVPYEPKLIKRELLSREQESWLAEFNKECLEKVGNYVLNDRKNPKAYDWVVARTGTGSGTTTRSASFALIVCLLALLAAVA